MPIEAKTLCTHLSYTTWATNRMLDAASKLTADELQRDFGTADKSVVGTLAHIFAADRVWMTRIRGEAPSTFLKPEERGLEFLNREWPPLLKAWEQWAAGLSDDKITATASYHDLKGNPWTTPLWQIVLHVVNHGTHHRGQVSGFIRALGHVPQPLDLMAYYREVA